MSIWQPIETHPKTPYEEVLMLVNTWDDEGLTHRIGMWDPEPVYWMPLPPPPQADGNI